MAEHMSAYIDAEKTTAVLDVTAGSGVLAAYAGAHGATGLAIDINQKAVANSAKNFARLRIPFQAAKSDVFDGIPNRRFDLILATPPYLDGVIGDPLDYAVHGTSHFIDKLVADARAYLVADGKMLVTYAEFGLIDEFERKLKHKGWACRLIGTKLSADSERRYNLYELS